MDEARDAVRENAPKVLNETVYKERIALTEEKSRASAIEEAIERAAALLVDDYDPAGVLPLENAARARLRIVLDDMLGIRAEHVERIKRERDRRDEEAAEKKRVALALSNPEAALRAECERIARVYAKRFIRDGVFPALTDDLREELRTFQLRSIDLHRLIVTFPARSLRPSRPTPSGQLLPELRAPLSKSLNASRRWRRLPCSDMSPGRPRRSRRAADFESSGKKREGHAPSLDQARLQTPLAGSESTPLTQLDGCMEIVATALPTIWVCTMNLQ